MYTIFDTNQNGVSASIAELVPLLKKHGIGGLNVPGELLRDEKAAVEAGKLMADNGLGWSLLPTPADMLSEDVSDEAFAAAVEQLKGWAATGVKMGVRYSYNHVWSGSNQRDTAENFDWVVGRVRQVWQVMHDHGIQYGLEFLGPCPLRNSFKYPFFNNIAGIFAIADAVDKSCGFLFDTYHWYTGSDCDRADLYLAAQHVDKMVNFHLNDGVPGRTREQQEDMERNMPLTTGVIDAALPYRLFEQKGYAGPVMCEPMRPWNSNPDKKSLEEVVAAVAQAYARVAQAAK